MQLRESIRQILSAHPAPAASTPFIDLTLRMASLYLTKRIRAGTLHPEFFGLTPDDLAIDCIGPLFERDARGHFVQLQSYYASVSWESLSDVELLAATRRIVFSKVHQQLTRLYKDHDPSLEKVLRNLRNAIKNGTTLQEERRGAELWVRSVSELPDQRLLPEMPWSFLEGELTGCLHEGTSLRDIVSQVARVFENQGTYRRSVPLTSLAMLLRTAYSRMNPHTDSTDPGEAGRMRKEEVDALIASALTAVEEKKRRTYVGKGKIEPAIFEAYVGAVRNILQAEFLENDGNEESYHTHLRTQLPGLTAEEYRTEHRCHLEYLAKLVREEFLIAAKREFLGDDTGNEDRQS
jgi:hypothetical protein